jgi:DNA-binding transcriptional ArsR family regulator
MTSDGERRAAARALSSPLRLRILRFCLHEPHTNREIADEFGLNPGTALHHVRTLVETGMLEAGAPTRGARGAREIRYRATGRSWSEDIPGASSVLIRAFLDDIESVPVDEIQSWRMGFRFDEATAREFTAELHALIERYMNRDAAGEGRPMSFFAAFHPEHRVTGGAPGTPPPQD